MTKFAEADREYKGNEGEGLKYYYQFINQFVKIPKKDGLTEGFLRFEP